MCALDLTRNFVTVTLAEGTLSLDEEKNCKVSGKNCLASCFLKVHLDMLRQQL
jgi:hypothetical protein